MAYCMCLKINFCLSLDDHTLANSAEIARFIRQGETIEINT
jgi:hypothetical protein